MSGYIKKDEKTGGKFIEDIRRLSLSYKESLGLFTKFYEELERGIVQAAKCRECGYKFYPPRNICPNCSSDKIEWFTPSKEGVLITYAEMNVKPLTHSHYDDYIVGIGEFDGVKILGLVSGEYGELSIGMKIKWDVSLREPEKYPIIVFKPIRK